MSQNGKPGKTFLIRDRVWHDQMLDHKLMRLLLDTRHLQRLRRVSMGGLAQFEFPGLTAKRLEHSFSTAWLLDRYYGQAIDQAAQPALSGDDSRKARTRATVLGLLHQIAIGPLSHHTDRFMQHLMGNEEEQRSLLEALILDALSEARMLMFWYGEPDFMKDSLRGNGLEPDDPAELRRDLADIERIVPVLAAVLLRQDVSSIEIPTGLADDGFELRMQRVLFTPPFGADHLEALQREATFSGVESGVDAAMLLQDVYSGAVFAETAVEEPRKSHAYRSTLVGTETFMDMIYLSPNAMAGCAVLESLLLAALVSDDDEYGKLFPKSDTIDACRRFVRNGRKPDSFVDLLPQLDDDFVFGWLDDCIRGDLPSGAAARAIVGGNAGRAYSEDELIPGALMEASAGRATGAHDLHKGQALAMFLGLKLGTDPLETYRCEKRLNEVAGANPFEMCLAAPLARVRNQHRSLETAIETAKDPPALEAEWGPQVRATLGRLFTGRALLSLWIRKDIPDYARKRDAAMDMLSQLSQNYLVGPPLEEGD